MNSWARAWLILALLAAYAAFIAVTLPALQAAPGGRIPPLDSRFFYTPEEAFSTVDSYGDASWFWIRIYLTWDIVNPLIYTFASSLLISWLLQRSLRPESRLQRLNLLPVCAGLFDLLENVSIVTLLAIYPTKLTIVAWLSTVCTMSKISFLGMSTVVVLIGLVLAMKNRFKRREERIPPGIRKNL